MTAIANGQLTRPRALRPNESLHLTKASSGPRGGSDHVCAFAGQLKALDAIRMAMPAVSDQASEQTI